MQPDAIERPDDDRLDWAKGDGLLPAIVHDAASKRVLMLGYLSPESMAETLRTGQVTFFSRSRQALWVKGYTSGNVLDMVSLHADCDGDALLVLANPRGPTCHRGAISCFDDAASGSRPDVSTVLPSLDALIAQRERERPAGSYATQLFAQGVRRIAQKVGEEGVETALAAVTQDDAALLDESADLIYHLLVLLRARGRGVADVERVLETRQAQ